MIHRILKIPFWMLVAAIFTIFGGCDREDPIRSYRSPKVPARASSRVENANAAASMQLAPVRLIWELPEGWREQPGDGGMRYATLTDERTSPPLVVTVSKLAGESGSLLANVNRWRQQIGLTEVQEKNLAACTRALQGGNIDGVLADLVNTSDPPRRMLAAIFETADTSWFFKASATKPAIDGAESELLALFASARIEPVDLARTSDDGLTQPNTADAKLLSYTVPATWREDPTPRTARIATLIVEETPKTELAITRFPGDVGGELANVNRWRGQLGLPQVPSLESLGGVDIAIGAPPQAGRLYEIGGDSVAPAQLGMLVAFAMHDGHTWFFKMTGPAARVKEERARFDEFLASVRFDVST